MSDWSSHEEEQFALALEDYMGGGRFRRVLPDEEKG